MFENLNTKHSLITSSPWWYSKLHYNTKISKEIFMFSIIARDVKEKTIENTLYIKIMFGFQNN